jgi:predicted N-formylglutamate amidohydrolase
MTDSFSRFLVQIIINIGIIRSLNIKPICLIITCEHGGNQIPKEYRYLFKEHRELLQSHRGYDIGALELAGCISKQLSAPLFAVEISRLFVDLNRSLYRQTLFSEITRRLCAAEKKSILDNYYYPHRWRVESETAKLISSHYKVLHIAVHSFTPCLNNKERSVDIGLLYNPQRKYEKAFCREWKHCIRERQPDLCVRFNYPYLGKPDGMAAHLRKQFKDENYIGVEFEVTQKHVSDSKENRIKLQNDISNSLAQTINNFQIPD